jgi:hypothetical protein
MTRGRTGSTAVIDELNKSRGLCAVQELFLIYDFDHIPDVSEITKVYNVILPFVLWKRQDWSRKWMPHFFYRNKQWSDRYLAKTEALAKKRGTSGFGFKVLSHNFDEWPFLSTLLKRRGYRAIYLTRNIARQVLSGMVANQSGIWNTREGIKNLSSYSINLDEFQRNVEWELGAVDRDCARLTAEGFRFIVVAYEEFCTDRQAFYDKIFRFLELPVILPTRSEYSILIKDLRATIANYDAVVERAIAIGMPLDS